GLANLPFNSFDANAAWLEIIMAATDLIAWTQVIGFTDNPTWRAARSKRSATGSCTSPPASPAAPDNFGCASTPPGAGRRRSPPPGPGSATPSPNTRTPMTRRDEVPTGPRKPRPTAATPGDFPYPPATSNPTSQPAPPPPDPARPHEKSRLVGTDELRIVSYACSLIHA